MAWQTESSSSLGCSHVDRVKEGGSEMVSSKLCCINTNRNNGAIVNWRQQALFVVFGSFMDILDLVVVVVL